jgi:chemotaxis signal transduction protein
MNEHPSTKLPSIEKQEIQDKLAYQSIDLLSEEEFWDYARALANHIPTPVSAFPQAALICELSQEAYIFPLSALLEVVPAPHRFARLPAMPAWMPGIVAWRDLTIAVVDLDAYLSDHHMARPTEGTLLVANQGNITVGLLVSTTGKTTTRQGLQATNTEESVNNTKREQLVFDIAALLAEVIEKIEVAATNG